MNKKKALATIGACALAGTMLVGGTLAYLTDTEKTTNTFTVGNITVDLEEPNYPGNGSDETRDLVSLQEVPKDPQMHNTGKDSAVMFMQVDIPMANVITAQPNGTRNDQENTELFDYKSNAIGTYDSINEGWSLLSTKYLNASDAEVSQAAAAKVRRLYGYKTVVGENQTTVPVFDTVRLVNIIEGQIEDDPATPKVDESKLDIDITGYAIQAENVKQADGTTDFNTSGTMNDDTLNGIWNVYWAQSKDVVSPDADATPNQTTIDSTMNVRFNAENTHLQINSGRASDAKTVGTLTLNYVGTSKATITPQVAAYTPAKSGDKYTFAAASDVVQITQVSDNVTGTSPYGVTHTITYNIVAKKEGTCVVRAWAENPDKSSNKVVDATVTVEVRDASSYVDSSVPNP